jgi:hypothetical protein
MQKRLQVISLIGALVLGVALGAVAEKQQHMRNALGALQNAAHQLEDAEHDKGGHREKALEHTQAAIHEVQEGIAVGNEH